MLRIWTVVLAVVLAGGAHAQAGKIQDTVIDTDGWTCTHIFVADPPADLVEGRIHVAVPWNWVRSIGDVVILRWFPPTPIPREL